MYLKITQKMTKQGMRKYAKVVEGYWDKESNLSRQRVILNLGPVNSEGDLNKCKRYLAELKKGNELIKFEDIKIESSKNYGVFCIVSELLDSYSLNNILRSCLNSGKHQFDVFEVIKALIVNRLEEPNSKLGSYDWIQNDYPQSLNIKLEDLYISLDQLYKKKETIENEFFEVLKKSLQLNTKKIHYDLTSSYVEGNCCILAKYGYSRDHRRDRKQVVLGLAMIDGIPAYHEVFEGNTVDKSTLKDFSENLTKVLGVQNPIFVADGGLITKDNLQALEDKNHEYILGCKRRKSKIAEQLLIQNINSSKEQSAKEIYKEAIIRDEKKFIRRYILCLNKNTKKERLETLKRIKERLENKLTELKDKYGKSQKKKKGKKITRDSLMQQANKILGKNKRIFNTSYEDGLKFSLNKENYEYEKRIAGKFLIVTNTDYEAMNVMKTYKELQTVENAFDELKNFLDIRPIYHWKEERVKAHIFLCILSFLIECIIEKNLNITAQKVIKQLKRIRMNFVQTNKSKKKILTELNKETEKIFTQLKIKPPIF